MIEALFHISKVSNDQGMEALLLVASKTGIKLPEGDLTPADLALLIWLNDPDRCVAITVNASCSAFSRFIAS